MSEQEQGLRSLAMKGVESAAENLKQAHERYETAMFHAWDLRIPNVKLAALLGVSETAVRTWFRRRARTKRGN